MIILGRATYCCYRAKCPGPRTVYCSRPGMAPTLFEGDVNVIIVYQRLGGIGYCGILYLIQLLNLSKLKKGFGFKETG